MTKFKKLKKSKKSKIYVAFKHKLFGCGAGILPSLQFNEYTCNTDIYSMYPGKSIELQRIDELGNLYYIVRAG